MKDHLGTTAALRPCRCSCDDRVVMLRAAIDAQRDHIADLERQLAERDV